MLLSSQALELSTARSLTLPHAAGAMEGALAQLLSALLAGRAELAAQLASALAQIADSLSSAEEPAVSPQAAHTHCKAPHYKNTDGLLTRLPCLLRRSWLVLKPRCARQSALSRPRRRGAAAGRTRGGSK